MGMTSNTFSHLPSQCNSENGGEKTMILNYLNPLYQETIVKEALERVTKRRSQHLFPEVRDPFLLC